MKPNVRAAFVGGLAGTFVVAVAVGPMLAGGSDQPASVSGRRASVEATTTTLAPQAVSTSIAPEPVVVERVQVVERRVEVLDGRVTNLETGSTTTTVPPYVPEVVVPVTVVSRPTTTTSTPTTMPPAHQCFGETC